jgi:hypothetical protein
MLTYEQAQTQAPQVWDKPTGIVNIGDYFHLPYTPVMQVVEKGMLADGRVWLLVKPMSGSYSEEWLVEPDPPALTQQPAPEPETECQPQEQQPVGFAGDSVGVELQPTGEAIAEFEQGKHHGREDALARLHPLYAQPSNEYATGYLEGYNSVLNPSPQPKVIESPNWSIQYDSNWDWYQVWVGDSCIGHGTDYQQAERIAQRYIAANKFWQQHRQAVVAAVAG